MTRHYAGFESGLWYIAEVTEGQTPATPSWLHLAHKSTVTISAQSPPNAVEKSGDRDFTGFKKGVEVHVATVTFNPSTASGQAFIKNFIDSDTSFSLNCMIDETSNVVFARMVGCKLKRITGSVDLYPTAGSLEVTAEIWAMDVLYDEVAGASYESAPSTFVNWSDVTVKKATVTLTNWWNFTFTMEQDLFRNPDNTGVIDSITRGRRRVDGSLTRSSIVGSLGNTEANENVNATAILYNFLIGADDYSFTASAINSAEVTHPVTGLTGIKEDFQASTFAVA